MVHIKLFIKNTLTNLFLTFYRGKSPDKETGFEHGKMATPGIHLPPEHISKTSPVQNE